MTRVRFIAAATVLAAAVGLAAASQDGGARQKQASSAVAAGPATSTAGPLDLLAPYIGGEWKCAGKWEGSSEPLVAREVFTWGPGRKFVNVRTFVTGPDGEYQRYEAVYGVKDGKLVSWNFTYDGKADTAEWVVEGRKWSTANAMPAPDGATTTLHQSVELVEPNKFRWVVETEQGGRRTKLFDGFWIRDGAGAAAR